MKCIVLIYIHNFQKSEKIKQLAKRPLVFSHKFHAIYKFLMVFRINMIVVKINGFLILLNELELMVH
jgi:hypothetical protein